MFSPVNYARVHLVVESTANSLAFTGPRKPTCTVHNRRDRPSASTSDVRWANRQHTYVFSLRGDPGVSGGDLVQQVDVRYRVLDVACEVADLAAAVGPGEVVVDPADENFLRGELHEILQCLSLHQQCGQVRIHVQVDVTQQTNLNAGKRQVVFRRPSLFWSRLFEDLSFASLLCS